MAMVGNGMGRCEGVKRDADGSKETTMGMIALAYIQLLCRSDMVLISNRE